MKNDILVAISKILYDELDFLEGDKIMRTTREELLEKEVIENFKEMLLNELKNKDITIRELDIQKIVSTIMKEIDVKS